MAKIFLIPRPHSTTTNGVSDKVAEELILNGEIEPLIVVGIYNAGAEARD